MSVLSKPSIQAGPTAMRPTGAPEGFYFFDTTLGQPIWALSNSPTGWVDAMGVTA